jgi:hypothetical protein
MSGKNTNKHGWLRDPKKPREGETIGGGYFIFRRGDGTKRIRPSQWPFEYASFDAAREQAKALAAGNPGYAFDVVAVLASERVEAAMSEAA